MIIPGLRVIKMQWKKVGKAHDIWFEWDWWDGVKGYFSTRKGRLSSLYDNISSKPLDRNIAYLIQTHSDKVCFVSSSGQYNGDGLASDNKKLILRVEVADCLAIYIYDPIKSVICLLHAGRKGTKNNILKNAIIGLNKRYGCIPQDLNILISPSICPKCYDIDLWSLNQTQARLMGVTRIINPRICTYENPNLFYSYRRDRCNERMHALLRFSE